jgi:hypothetical protein
MIPSPLQRSLYYNELGGALTGGSCLFDCDADDECVKWIFAPSHSVRYIIPSRPILFKIRN